MKKLRIMLENSFLNKNTKIIYSNGSIRAVGLSFIKKTPTEKAMNKIIRKSNCMEILDKANKKVKRLNLFK